MAKDLPPPGKLKKLLPMPPVGWPIQFFEHGDPKAVFAGHVDRHGSGPGYLRTVYHAGTVHRTSDNATYAPLVAGTQLTPTTLAHGTWDYLPGQEIPDEHFAFHEQLLVSLEKAAVIREANQRAVEKSYQESLKQTPDVSAAIAQRAVMEMAALQQQQQG